MPSEDTDADNVLSVAKGAAFEQDLIRLHWDFSPILQHKVALKFVKILVRGFAVDLGAHQVAQGNFGRAASMLQYLQICLLLLQVGLSVQVLRLNVADSLRQRALNENEVCGEELILVHFNDAADLELETASLTETFRA